MNANDVPRDALFARAVLEAWLRHQAAVSLQQTPKPQPTGADVVRAAKAHLGVPYVWGGESPKGFDCSGLVRYVLGKLGVDVPHFAASQYDYGTHVTRDELQPGDLVFFGSPIYHVGIYAGDGKMIDAPRTGAVVRIEPLFNGFSGATRIF